MSVVAASLDPSGCASLPRATVYIQMPHALHYAATNGGANHAVDLKIQYQSSGGSVRQTFTTPLRDVMFLSHDDHGHVILVSVAACLSAFVDSGTEIRADAALHRGR